ncbi:hypothetical protein Y032_0003g1437 [Ancylostoma ceylanicum]|nr:hypothetical protein Y032_0003g1437 [Ancylostoma ceylanicum]
MLYLEMIMGQCSNYGPTKLYALCIPALEGLGWAMTIISFTVSVYYCVIVAWSFLYLFNSIVGGSSLWGKCDNAWNDIYCAETAAMEECTLEDPLNPIAFNRTCIPTPFEEMKTSYDQYFTNVITKRSDGIEHCCEINWPTLIALTAIWLLVGLTLVKGYVYLGKIAYVAAVAPYVIIVIMFCRAITLDGAIDGISYYFARPNIQMLLHHETWSAALIQVCFTLNIGYGGIIVIASYNAKNNNCYKDALTVTIAVTLISIVGGVVVFATLGHISRHLHRPIDAIASSGLSVVFVTYPEAMRVMPFPSIWITFFFAMLSFLSLGSLVVFVETICTSIYDQWPNTRKRKWLVAVTCCVILLILGIIMTTESGFFWFTLFDQFGASTSVCLVVSIEAFMLMHVFGYSNIRQITIEMFGERPKSILSMFGPHSRLWECCWKFFIPAVGLVHVLFTMMQSEPIVKHHSRLYKFPHWALVCFNAPKLFH